MTSLEVGNNTPHETSKSNNTNHNMEHANPNTTIHNMEHSIPTAQSTILNTQIQQHMKWQSCGRTSTER